MPRLCERSWALAVPLPPVEFVDQKMTISLDIMFTFVVFESRAQRCRPFNPEPTKSNRFLLSSLMIQRASSPTFSSVYFFAATTATTIHRYEEKTHDKVCRSEEREIYKKRSSSETITVSTP